MFRIHALLLLSFALLLGQATGVKVASKKGENVNKKTKKQKQKKGGKKGMLIKEEGGSVTVMSRNIYLGTSLFLVQSATDFASFQASIQTVLGILSATDYVGARSAALADEILVTKPDLIGIQEGATYLFDNVDGTPKQQIDFIEILLMQLKERGLNYSVATTSLNSNIGPVPLGSELLTFQMSDVILVNDDSTTLSIEYSYSSLYPKEMLHYSPSLLGPLESGRSVSFVDATIGNQKFRFANTHLEVLNGEINEAQAMEFLNIAVKTTNLPVIAVGDMNANVDGSGPCDAVPFTDTYAILTEELQDAWVSGEDGFTCCRSPGLDGSADLYQRIDYIFYRGEVENISIDLVGNEPFQATQPVFASDHVGLVAKFILKN